MPIIGGAQQYDEPMAANIEGLEFTGPISAYEQHASRTCSHPKIDIKQFK